MWLALVWVVVWRDPWCGLGALCFVRSLEGGELYDGDEAARVVPAALLCGGDASFLTFFSFFFFFCCLAAFVLCFCAGSYRSSHHGQVFP